MEKDKLEKGYDSIYINDKGELVMRKGTGTPKSEIKRLNEMFTTIDKNTTDDKNDNTR